MVADNRPICSFIRKYGTDSMVLSIKLLLAQTKPGPDLHDLIIEMLDALHAALESTDCG